jgi:hypothetical protein
MTNSITFKQSKQLDLHEIRKEGKEKYYLIVAAVDGYLKI